MSGALAVCFAVAAWLTFATGLMLVVPASLPEVRVWRRLRVASFRRWLTRRRRVDEPLHPVTTSRVARRNLQWHLALSALFTVQLGIALGSEDAWWRPLSLPLVVPCVAYFFASVVQRQKIAIVRTREDARAEGGE